MKVSLCLFTPLACLFLHSCTTSISTLEKRHASEVKPLTSTPEKLLIGGWGRRANADVYWGFQANGVFHLDLVGDWRSNLPLKWYYKSNNRMLVANGAFFEIKFINDRTMVVKNEYSDGFIMDRVPLRKAPKAPATPKRAMTAAKKAAFHAREDRVKAGKDWYVKRELGQNPGPMPHLSSLERELAYCDYKLKTTVDVDEIIYYMGRGAAIRERLKYDD